MSPDRQPGAESSPARRGPGSKATPAGDATPARKATPASKGGPAGKGSPASKASPGGKGSPASKASPGGKGSPASPVSRASPASKADPDSKTGAGSPTSPTSNGGTASGLATLDELGELGDLAGLVGLERIASFDASNGTGHRRSGGSGSGSGPGPGSAVRGAGTGGVDSDDLAATATEAAPEPPDTDGRSVPREPLADAGELERALAGLLAFLRRRITGDYVVDEHGFDPDLTEHVVAPLLRPIYRNYFRVETRGLENIPDRGGALVVSNHSGTLPMDALMTALAILDHHPSHRHLRMLAADLVFAVPFLAPLARKTGNTLACQADAERLLSAGHLVGVWPEGFKGIGKPFSERYKLQRFGRGGFVSSALRSGVPIIPCTVVGAEEIYPMVGNAKTLARLLGLPYVPITPTFPWLGLLGLVPLPSKWIIEFGEPVDTAPYTPAAAEDPMLLFELTDQIRETIQHTLYGLLMQRRSVFF